MKKVAVIVLAFALLMTALTVLPVFATPSAHVSGQIIITGTSAPVVKVAGESGNRMVEFSITGTFTGDIAGAYTSASSWIRHGVGTSSSWTIVYGIDALPEATFGGNTGGLTILIQGATPGGNRPFETTRMTWKIIGATGDLKGLHGGGTSIQVGPGTINYEGEVHFES